MSSAPYFDYCNKGSSKVRSKLDELPKGDAVTCGKGGGPKIMWSDGPLRGWIFGGEKRGNVFGDTLYPTTPPPRTIPWGFLPIANFLGNYPSNADLSLYYESLPQEVARPGGQLVEMRITPLTVTVNSTDLVPTPPFFFVSDRYTADQVGKAVYERCLLLDVGSPVPFNSSGSIQLGNVLQYYRGDSAAVVFPGYGNTQGVPYLTGSMPIPDSRVDAWPCINSTIGQTIPLVDTGLPMPRWAFAVISLSAIYWTWRNLKGRTLRAGEI